MSDASLAPGTVVTNRDRLRRADGRKRGVLIATSIDGGEPALHEHAAAKGMRHNERFCTVSQALLEMESPKSRERTLLKPVVVRGRGQAPDSVAGKYEQSPLFVLEAVVWSLMGGQ